MEPLAYLNGRLIPAGQLSVAVTDAGFVQGVTIAEQLRTFNGRLFRLPEHLQRLSCSLEAVGISGVDVAPLASAAEELAANNHRLLAPGDDLGLCLFVTPGAYPAMMPAGEDHPTVAMHTFPVPFRFWADKYSHGQKLVVTKIRQVPESCWPPELKCRSRMHYYLADQQARQIDPQARAVLLDQDGWVSEASTANIVIYRESEGIVSPPREKILPGVSVATLEELCAELQVSFSHRPLSVEDLQAADEVILSSTSPCLVPVSAVDGQAIGVGSPGPMFTKAIAAWSQRVGIDIVGQAVRFQNR
jgi:branched-subunit amino acid aminotransferase/4-amino-4-deoxychorismate lyase